MNAHQIASWAVAAGVIAAVCVVTLLARRGVRHWRGHAIRSATFVDDVIVQTLQRTRWWMLVAFAVLVGFQFAPLDLELRNITRTALSFVVVIQVAFWIDRALVESIDRARSLKSHNAEAFTTISTLGFVGKLGVWSLVLTFVLANLGVDITALVTGLGIGGVAVALAMQSVLADLLASISIVFDKPFVVGDYIEVGPHYSGTVEHVGIKTTRVRSRSGEQIVFSNSDLLTSRIRNFGRMTQRRGEITVHVPLETDPDLLREIPEALARIVDDEVHAEPEQAFLEDRLESTFKFTLEYRLLVADVDTFRSTHENINVAIHRWLSERGVAPGYPTRNMRVWEATNEVPRVPDPIHAEAHKLPSAAPSNLHE